MNNLHKYGLVPVIRDMINKGKPFLGICLGLQLLFESSEESPGVEGLGILKGKILRIPASPGLKIPHMGSKFSSPSEPGEIVSGDSRRCLRLFCPFLLSQAEEPEIVKASSFMEQRSMLP